MSTSYFVHCENTSSGHTDISVVLTNHNYPKYVHVTCHDARRKLYDPSKWMLVSKQLDDTITATLLDKGLSTEETHSHPQPFASDYGQLDAHNSSNDLVLKRTAL